MEMAEQEYRQAINRVKKSWRNWFDKSYVKDAGHQIFVQYIEDKDEISGELAAEFADYGWVQAVRLKDVLEKEFEEVQAQNKAFLQNLTNEFIYLKSGKTFFTPLEIFRDTSVNFLETFSEECTTEEAKYRLFKAWFFSYVVASDCKYKKDMVIYYITDSQMTEIRAHLPKMWEKLQREGKERYKASRYQAEKHRIEDVERQIKEHIRSVDQEELYKIVEVIKDGRKIRVCD